MRMSESRKSVWIIYASGCDEHVPYQQSAPSENAASKIGHLLKSGTLQRTLISDLSLVCSVTGSGPVNVHGGRNGRRNTFLQNGNSGHFELLDRG